MTAFTAIQVGDQVTVVHDGAAPFGATVLVGVVQELRLDGQHLMALMHGFIRRPHADAIRLHLGNELYPFRVEQVESIIPQTLLQIP